MVSTGGAQWHWLTGRKGKRTVRSDLDPLEMAAYLCVSWLSVLNLDPRWKMALAAGGISYDQFMNDFRRFISPSITSRRKADDVFEEDHK